MTALSACGLALVGCVACLLYKPWSQPLLKDNQHYFFLSERAASGVAPHVSHFDPKHELSTLLTGAAIFVGRFVGASDLAAARILSIGLTGLTVALVFLLARRLVDDLWAANLSAMIMLCFPGFLEMAAMGAQPKVIMVPFILLTALSVAHDRYFLSGLFSVLGFLCWQPIILLFPVVLLVAFFRQSRLKKLAWSVLGAVVPYALYEAYFAYMGATTEMHEQAYSFPVHYMSGKFEGLRVSADEVAASWVEGFGFLTLFPLILGIVCISAIVAVTFRYRQAMVLFRERPVWIFFIIAGMGLLAFSFYDHQSYPDLFLLLPWVALGCGLGCAAVLSFVFRGRNWWIGKVVTGALLAGTVYGAVIGPARFPYAFDLQDQVALAEQVRAYRDRGYKVYAVGCTHLLAFLRTDNHNHYGFFFRGLPEYIEDRYRSKAAYRPLDSAGDMPDIVIRSRKLLPGRKSWLKDGYIQLLDTKDFEAQDVDVWRRRDVR